MRVLHEAGHTAYFAGGCVRDRIMGREASDYDVATDAPPDRVLSLFRAARAVGEAFGVVMVRIAGCWVEVATFRAEWGYADGRHPDHVEYADAERDARRRDFTINGLFEDPLSGRVIDFVGGQADIKRRVVRAIGEPSERFAEDYLRMLRAVRFAAKLGFELDPATADAIKRHAPKLDRISRERIGAELRMMLEHPSRATAAELMQRLTLDAPALGEPTSNREPLVLAALPDGADYPTALGAWALDRHLEPHRPATHAELVAALRRMKPAALVRRWRDALTLSNAQREALRELLEGAPRAARWFDLDIAQRKRLLARRDWVPLRSLLGAVAQLAASERLDLAELDRAAAELGAQGVAPAPLITGDALIAEGLKPGPMFKALLDRVYDAQLSGEVRTQREAIALAKALADGP